MNFGEDALELWSNLICKPRHERTDRELVQMSLDERAEVFSDISGAQQINPEDPDFVCQRFDELDAAIANIKHKSAFEQAQQISREYTDRRSFRLMFLRADNFDVGRCANRIVRHFQEKLELFGPSKLDRDITLEDLSEDDMDALKAGGVQFLPHHDQYGRLVLCSRQVSWKYARRENLLRAMWYMCMSCVEDESVQRRGLVGLGYSVGEVTGWSSDYEMVRRMVGILNALPIRLLAIYTCFNSRRIESVVDVVVHMFNSFLRARFRALLGTRQECNYQLMLMGITHTDVPVSEDGRLLLDNHIQWLQNRINIETERKKQSCQMDVDSS